MASIEKNISEGSYTFQLLAWMSILVFLPLSPYRYLGIHLYLDGYIERWRERRPSVISASGSLDLVDLHGQTGTIRDQSKAAVAPATTQFPWQDPSLSTKSSRGEKPSACFPVPGVAGSSLGGTSYPNTDWSGFSLLLKDTWEKHNRNRTQQKKKKKNGSKHCSCLLTKFSHARTRQKGRRKKNKKDWKKN